MSYKAMADAHQRGKVAYEQLQEELYKRSKN